MDRVVGELKRRALALRTTPLLRVMENLPRVAREVAARVGKRVEVTLAGAELELDRSILDRLYDPLVHLVRNSVDHGLETPEARLQAGKSEIGKLRIEATREKDAIRIAVCDDGAGMNLSALRERAVSAGLLHATLAEDLPARGDRRTGVPPGALDGRAGLGHLRSRRRHGRGARRRSSRSAARSGSRRDRAPARRRCCAFRSRPPCSACCWSGSVTRSSPCRSRRSSASSRSTQRAIEGSAGECFVLLDDEPVVVLDLAERLGWQAAANDNAPLVVAELRGERVALRVAKLAGQQDIYVKPLPALLASLRVLAGLTVLGDGRPVFLLDLNQLP